MFRLARASIGSLRGISPSVSEELWLPVDEVVHHDNVMVPIVIRTGGHVAGLDADRCDAGVIEHDAEEGLVSIAWRSRNGTAEQQSAVSIEVLDERVRPAVAEPRARTAVWLINICEHRAEGSDCCRDSAIGPGYEEQSFGNVASYRSEQSRFAEGSEGGAVGGIAKEHR